MYERVKSKVVTLQGESNFFECSVGVRQGEKLSPFLFSIYLNELESFLSEKGVTGVRRHVSFRNSTGEVIIFFDSHMEVNIDW